MLILGVGWFAEGRARFGWQPPNLVVLGLLLLRQGAVAAAAACAGIGGAGRATGTRGGRVAVLVAAALLLFEAARGLLGVASAASHAGWAALRQ